MRCDCCQRFLSDYESTLRHTVSREFLDTCVKCLDGLEIPYVGRSDLRLNTQQEELEEQANMLLEEWDDEI